MADGMRPLEPEQAVLLGDVRSDAQILHQLQRGAQRQYLRSLDILDVVGETTTIAGKADAVPVSVLGGRRRFQDRSPQLGDSGVDDFSPLRDLPVDVEAFPHFLLLGQLQPHDQVVVVWRAVQREPGRIRASMLERLQHRRHFLADRAGVAAMNQSRNPAHTCLTRLSTRGGSTENRYGR